MGYYITDDDLEDMRIKEWSLDKKREQRYAKSMVGFLN